MFRRIKWIEDAGYMYFRFEGRVYLCLPNINVLISQPYRAGWHEHENVNWEPWEIHPRGLSSMGKKLKEHVAALEQHCYCRVPKERSKCDYCQGYKKPPQPIYRPTNDVPMPGDWVEITNNDDGIAPTGTMGCIDGCVGEARPEYLVIFNPYTPFRDDRIVSTSGGPGYFLKAKDLMPTLRVEKKRFWRWKCLPCADGGYDYSVPVRIWEWSKK